jgi:hypothetical protein
MTAKEPEELFVSATSSTGWAPTYDSAERPEGQWVLFEEERQVHPLSDAGSLVGKSRYTG